MLPLTITQEQKEAVLKDFQLYLQTISPSNGKVDYTAPWSKFLPIQAGEKAILDYSMKAYMQIKSLVSRCTDEVGWHGLAYRTPHGYRIEEIFTYPQTVTGATISCDADAYAMWNMTQDDETVNNTRYHGHSHVNMGTTPSGVDAQFRQDILTKLQKDEFYIFQIFNKAGSIHHTIYDLAKNTCYEDKDVIYRIEFEGGFMDDWLDAQLSHVKKYEAKFQPWNGGQQTSFVTRPTTPAEKNDDDELVDWKKAVFGNRKKLPTKEYDARMRRWVVTSPYGSKCYYATEPKGEFANESK